MCIVPILFYGIVVFRHEHLKMASGTNLKEVIGCIKLMFSVCLPDSVLAFHKHGMQGRSFKNGEVTQEIVDQSRVYRLLGSDK
jgi:hypothetical protein